MFVATTGRDGCAIVVTERAKQTPEPVGRSLNVAAIHEPVFPSCTNVQVTLSTGTYVK